MSLQQQIITDMTMGELSPRMMGRFDLQSYFRGARELTNVLPFFPGGVTFRPGFTHVGLAKGTGKVRLHPFILSQTFAYIIEFGPLYARFWRDDTLVGGGTPVELVTPWSAGDLPNLQFAQKDSTLYIASGTAPIKALTMTSTDIFSFGDLTITGTAGQLPFQGAGNYPKAITMMDGRLYAAGTDNEPNAIWASRPFLPGDFTYYDTITSTSRQLRDPQYNFTGDVSNGSKTINTIPAADIAKIKNGDRITGPGIPNKDKVTFVASTTSGSSTISDISSGVVASIAIGETISGQGIPVCQVISKGTNSLGLSAAATNTSATNTMTREAIYSFVTSVGTTTITISEYATATQATAPLVDGWPDPTIPQYADVTETRDVFTSASAFKKVTSEQAGRILWLATGRALIVGTTSGERLIPSGATAVNFSIQKQTAIGSAAVQPFMLNEAILFVESNKKGVREYLYSMQEEAYQSPSLTALAEHILESGVVEMDYQNTPQPIVWATLADGTLAGCSYSRVNQMSAWFHVRHGDGAIESVAVIPEEGNDVLYASVLRGTVRSIERLGDQLSPEGHLDASAVKIKAAGQITSLTWLSGAVTVTWGSGNVSTASVVAGTASLPATIPDGIPVTVGIPYTGRILTMPIQTQARIGNGQMREKVISAIAVKTLESYPFLAGYEGAGMEEASWTGTKTGNHRIPIQGSWDTDGSILIEQDKPLDMTILAIAPEVDAGG